MNGPAHNPNRMTLLGRVAPSRHAFPKIFIIGPGPDKSSITGGDNGD